MVRELQLRGFTAGKERVERLMRENGIRARLSDAPRQYLDRWIMKKIRK